MSFRPRLLFTAPHAFLPSLAPLIDAYDVTFEEAWDVRDLPDVLAYDCWIPNPGQHFVIRASLLDRMEDLVAIATPSTGRNHIDEEACRERGIAVLSLLDDRAALDSITASAEFTFLHVLNALRRIDVALNAVQRGEWRDHEDAFRGGELSGRRIGLVGYGRIGRRLARYFTAFECRMSAFDPHVRSPMDVNEVGSLVELFESSDIVVVCCSLTDETRGLIGRDLLERLPVGAILVNTSRGEVFREKEVVNFCDARQDVTVAVDVISGEVDGSYTDSPLLRAADGGQVLVTPHIAGATVDSQHKAALIALRLLRDRLSAMDLVRTDDGG